VFGFSTGWPEYLKSGIFGAEIRVVGMDSVGWLVRWGRRVEWMNSIAVIIKNDETTNNLNNYFSANYFWTD
jgi:hypothetical protein